MVVTLVAPRTSAFDHRTLSAIDFFGYKGLDVSAIRGALPFREGDAFPPPKVHSDDLKRQVTQRVRQVIGRDPTDIGFVCCDAKQNFMVYIGLPGESYQPLVANSVPSGAVRLPKAAVSLREKYEDALEGAVMNGHASEDDSAGYSLSDDPKARRAELAVRDYALRNEALLLEVVASSSDARHRSIAAQMIGYGNQSDAQLDALVHASLDPSDEVRNDAIRALWVLAGAKPELTPKIPLEAFGRLMHSGSWADHNKSSLLLVALTEGRDPKVLAQLRAEALDPLLEMARWHSRGHAEAALTILGRMAGIEESRLRQLIESGDASAILASFAGDGGRERRSDR
jgi:hypothetical protein